MITLNSDELKKQLSKLKVDKKALFIIGIGLFGMMLIMLSDTDKDKIDTLSTDSTLSVCSENELARSVEEFIGTIHGAGKTKVMITYECYEETVYIYDKDERIRNDGETDIANEHIILDTGEDEEGLKSKIIAPKIRGVAVVCQGGNDPVTKEMIITALSSLLDISSNKISVAPMAN